MVLHVGDDACKIYIQTCQTFIQKSDSHQICQRARKVKSQDQFLYNKEGFVKVKCHHVLNRSTM